MISRAVVLSWPVTCEIVERYTVRFDLLPVLPRSGWILLCSDSFELKSSAGALWTHFEAQYGYLVDAVAFQRCDLCFATQ